MERAELGRRLGVGCLDGGPRNASVDESHQVRFMDRFREAVSAGGTVFVMDPSWGTMERERFAALTERPAANRNLQPAGSQSEIGDQESNTDRGWLCLPTGGSSGVLRLARHDQDTVAAAVRGCCGHFGVDRIDAVGVLPLNHVSGLMAWMRSALTGGRYVPCDWAEMEAGRWPQIASGNWFLSLVPTQLQRLLSRSDAIERLRRFRAVFVGGGPTWPDLLDRAAEARLPLSPGYGMTETAAMVAALRPEEFLAGRRGCGAALPHARLQVDPDGRIQIMAESLYRGYYPDWRDDAGFWPTEDLGQLDAHGSLQVLGRRDAVIISGGKKIDPAEIEAVLRATGQFADIAVVGVPDVEWGEAVVACYPAGMPSPDLASVERILTRDLAPYKRPKHYQPIPWPRNAQGKINRLAVTAAALATRRT